MLSLTIDKSSVREFMVKLIKEDKFDFLEVRSVEIEAFARFQITGSLNRDFLPDKDGSDERIYCTWKEIRPYVFNIIKGDRRPRSMKIVLSLPSDQVGLMHPNAAAYFLNIYFEGDETYCTTAVAEKVFSMDRTMEVKWEEYIKEFMSRAGIATLRQ